LVCALVAAMVGASPADSLDGYAGFASPGRTPAVFAPGLISTDSYEFAVTFTPDMGEMYFTRRSDPGPNHIFVARVVGGELQAPVRAGFSASGGQYEPCVAPDGGAVYFGEGVEIMVSHRNGDQWAAPQPLPGEVNGGFAMAACVDAAGNLHFTGNTGLMEARRHGDGYHPAVSLGPQFERPAGGSAHGSLAPDGTYLVFDSQGRSEGMGRTDLYVSFREGDSWGEPKHLAGLNTSGTDMCASISPDGRFLFFSRDGDIWWVDAAVVQQNR